MSREDTIDLTLSSSDEDDGRPGPSQRAPAVDKKKDATTAKRQRKRIRREFQACAAKTDDRPRAPGRGPLDANEYFGDLETELPCEMCNARTRDYCKRCLRVFCTECNAKHNAKRPQHPHESGEIKMHSPGLHCHKCATEMTHSVCIHPYCCSGADGEHNGGVALCKSCADYHRGDPMTMGHQLVDVTYLCQYCGCDIICHTELMAPCPSCKKALACWKCFRELSKICESPEYTEYDDVEKARREVGRQYEEEADRMVDIESLRKQFEDVTTPLKDTIACLELHAQSTDSIKNFLNVGPFESSLQALHEMFRVSALPRHFERVNLVLQNAKFRYRLLVCLETAIERTRRLEQQRVQQEAMQKLRTAQQATKPISVHDIQEIRQARADLQIGSNGVRYTRVVARHVCGRLVVVAHNKIGEMQIRYKGISAKPGISHVFIVETANGKPYETQYYVTSIEFKLTRDELKKIGQGEGGAVVKRVKPIDIKDLCINLRVSVASQEEARVKRVGVIKALDPDSETAGVQFERGAALEYLPYDSLEYWRGFLKVTYKWSAKIDDHWHYFVLAQSAQPQKNRVEIRDSALVLDRFPEQCAENDSSSDESSLYDWEDDQCRPIQHELYKTGAPIQVAGEQQSLRMVIEKQGEGGTAQRYVETFNDTWHRLQNVRFVIDGK